MNLFLNIVNNNSSHLGPCQTSTMNLLVKMLKDFGLFTKNAAYKLIIYLSLTQMEITKIR